METKTSWLARRALNSKALIRLFCFPYAGGGDSIYRLWQNMLPDTFEVCPVQLPGRGIRIKEQPFTEIAPLVEAATLALMPHMKEPFAIFGHSMGALIGFEVARLLKRKYGIQPVHIFVSGRCSPQTAIDPDEKNLSDVEFIKLLSTYNGTPKEVLDNPELMELMLPLIRADFAVCRSFTYTPLPPLDCPITAFGGLLDPNVKRDCIEGWREHTQGTFLVRMLPGDHFFLNTDRPFLLDTITRELYQHIRDFV